METLNRLPIRQSVTLIRQLTIAARSTAMNQRGILPGVQALKEASPSMHNPLSLTPAGTLIRDGLKLAARNSANGVQNSAVSGANGINGAGGNEPPQTPIEKLEALGLRNITREARDGDLDPVFERSDEMAELSKRLKGGSNAILIGNTGVGKTAIVEGLAQEWKDEEKTFFFSLGMKDLDRSVLEPQLKQIVETVQEAFKQGYTVYLLMDELHLMEQAGVLELLKEPLARPGFQVVGATTTSEFYRYFNNDATKRRFGDPINIESLTGDKLRRLVRNIIPVILDRLKGTEKIEVPPGSRQAAIDLSPLIVNRFPPDATIALIKEAIGSKRSQLGDLRRVVAETPKKLADDINDLIEFAGDPATRSQLEVIWKSVIGIVAAYLESELLVEKVVRKLAETGCLTIAEDDIRAQASKMAGLDLRKMDELDIQQLSQIEARIRTRFIGQDQAVKKVAGAIKRYKTGRRKKQSPIAAFMFTGPTGTGKTELAHTLAWLLFGNPQKVMTIDMTQCEGKAGKTLLFGPDPGFVGFDKTKGMLPELFKRKENRHGVLLLDEADKADPDVYDSLLVMLDQGYVQNKETGEKYSLEDVVVIMTSNQGEKQMLKPEQIRELSNGKPVTEAKKITDGLIEANRRIAADSFKNQKDEYGRDKYPPAFLRRLDIVPFDYLTEADLSAIADIQLKNFIAQVETDQKLEVVLGGNDAEYQAIKQYIMERGTDLAGGARPLKQAVEEHLDNAFSAWLVNNMPGGEYIIKVSVKNGELVFEETADKSERGRQMDIAQIHGRRGIILRKISQLVAEGKEVTAAIIGNILSPLKGKEKIELWFEENAWPAEATARAETLAKLKQNLTVEDRQALEAELPELLKSENQGILAVALSLVAELKPLGVLIRIEALRAHEDPFIASLAEQAWTIVEGTSKFNLPAWDLTLAAGEKNKVDRKVNAARAGLKTLMVERNLPDVEQGAVLRALSDLIYAAKDRQEKLTGEERDKPITVRWRISPANDIQLSVHNADTQNREEGPRLTQFRTTYIEGTNRSLVVRTAETGTTFVFSIIASREIVVEISPPVKLTPILSVIPQHQIRTLIIDLAASLTQTFQGPTKAKFDKMIAELFAPANPRINSFEDLINDPDLDPQYKTEIINLLIEMPEAPKFPKITLTLTSSADGTNLIFTLPGTANVSEIQRQYENKAREAGVELVSHLEGNNSTISLRIPD
ncbi:MAG: AAA family ATPase [Candidatus Margulisbacteria bacterium]|nr:AAA family ATPase [Candidatus Margulisiibacteriota bacterium]